MTAFLIGTVFFIVMGVWANIVDFRNAKRIREARRMEREVTPLVRDDSVGKYMPRSRCHCECECHDERSVSNFTKFMQGY